MKVALLHSPENTEIAHSLGKIITDNNCKVTYFDSGEVWKKESYVNPLLILENASHLLYVSSSDINDFQTFLFFAGFALGKDIRLIVIEAEHTFKFPENTRHLGIFLELESFEDFFTAEISRYHEQDKKNQARAILLERGISCFDENFILIVSSGDAESVSLFLEAGFSPSLTDSRGTPLLSLAVRAQFPSVVSLLLKAGADVNRLSLDRGYSPLMDAVQKGDVAIAQILLDHGADGNLKSKDSQTALIIAAGRGDIALCDLLVSKGSDPTIKDSLGMSAMSYATLFKNEKLLSLFNMSST